MVILPIILGAFMSMDKNTIVVYIISLVITLAGFSLVFFARNTLVLAGGALLIIVGLFLFLIGREKIQKRK